MTYNKFPETIIDLINLLKTLPGVGGRSAVRMAFAILKWKPEKQKTFGSLIAELDQTIAHCPECGNIAEKNSKCEFCTDLSRNNSNICVVEEVTQIQSIEASALFRGRYHVLGGRIAPLEGKGVNELNIASLVKRIEEGETDEVILALGQDVEGQATAIYISDILKDKNIKVTRLARGLPAGSDIAYADAATIAAALSGRTPLKP
jgi:recombination protein RecR